MLSAIQPGFIDFILTKDEWVGPTVKTQPKDVYVQQEKGWWGGWLFCKLVGANFVGGGVYSWKDGTCGISGDSIESYLYKY